MSVFGTRHAFRTTARASLRIARINASSSSSRIRMNSSSHGAPSTKTSSDTPWLIASALVFGPAFLYLVSPSAKEKAHHHEHIHKSEPVEAAPESEPDSEPAVVVMKDDEGTEANVAESIRQAEKDDVPKAEPAASESTDESPVSTAEATSPVVPASTPKTPSGPAPGDDDDSPTNTLGRRRDEKPKDLGEPRKLAREGATPKEAKEAKEADSRSE